MLPIMAALLSRDLSKEVNLQRYASFLLFSLAGLLFSNPVYAAPPPLSATSDP